MTQHTPDFSAARGHKPARRPARRRLVGAGLAALALVGVTLTACGSAEPRNLLESIKSGHVTLGTKFDQPGLGLRHPDKSVSGFDVSVSTYTVNWIAENVLHVEPPQIKWKETPSAQRETLIQNGEVDMIAASYSINKARSESVNFAGPYLITYQGLLVRKSDGSIQTLTDLNNGKKLCSVTGSTPAQNVKNQLGGVQLQEFDTYALCVEGLHREKVDALTTDEIILAGYAAQYGDEFALVDMVNQEDVCNPATNSLRGRKGAPFSTERYGIGLAKDDQTATDAINDALRAMIDTGEWERAFRANAGDETVYHLVSRSTGEDATFASPIPTPGDLSFLDPSDPVPCGGAA